MIMTARENVRNRATPSHRRAAGGVLILNRAMPGVALRLTPGEMGGSRVVVDFVLANTIREAYSEQT